MNRNKEVMIRICLYVSLCSMTLGVNSILHKENNFNGDKLISDKNVNVVTDTIDKSDYNVFMENVKDSEIKRLEEIRIAKVKKEEALKQEKLLIAKKKAEDKEKARLLAIEKNNMSMSRGGDLGDYDTTFNITYYTSLYGFTMSSGKRVFEGACASNTLPNGSRVKLEGMGEFTILDCGGSDLNASNRLDIFIGRNQGESNSQYRNRVLRLGRTYVKGKVIK